MIIAGIPAYNEEKTIARVVLLAQRYADKVIVCDDGSTDLTGEIGKKLGAIVVQHEKRSGYGAAIRSLFQEAQRMDADAMVTLDADGQHNPQEIPRLLKPIQDDEADIVIGSRFLGKEKSDMPAYRRFGIKLITKLNKGMIEERISDAQSGFRAYNRKAIRSLRILENGMGVSAEILLNSREQGLKIKEVSIVANYKGVDTSTYNPVRHGLSVIGSILKLVVEERPLYYLGMPGAFLISIGMIFGFWALQLYITEGRLVTNVALAAAAFLLIGVVVSFTAITLFAIIRATERRRAQVNH